VIADKITDIIAVEGPVQVKRVYDVYLKGLGLKRLGRELKRNLNKSLRVALDSGRVVQKNEDQKSGYIYLFVRAIDAPMIRVREAGPRSFEQIPLTELAAVMERLAPEFARGSEEHFRAVLHHYGFRRLTRGTEERLERALEWAHQIGAQF